MGGTYADLSTCQLWTRRVARNSEMRYALKSFVVSAVLWRLLPKWEGCSAEHVQPGHILEVLFLATHLDFQQDGEGMTLVQELEDVARALGCAAMCVAAVPQQGVKFWKRCGFRTAVHLK